MSRFYNPINSNLNAIAYLFSKFWAKQALEGTEQKLKDILLNPKDAMKVMSVVGSQAKSIDLKKVKEASDVMTRYGIDYVNAATRDFLTGGARGQVQQMQSEE